MKVRVTLTIPIDTDSWQVSYGTAAEDIREDVKDYVDSIVHEHLSSLGLLEVVKSKPMPHPATRMVP
jgi:hypothetical protein